MHYGITLWVYLSELLVKDSQKPKFDRKAIIPHAQALDQTLPLRTCYGETYGNIVREENG